MIREMAAQFGIAFIAGTSVYGLLAGLSVDLLMVGMGTGVAVLSANVAVDGLKMASGNDTKSGGSE